MAYGSPTSRLIRNRIRYPDSIKESYIQKVPEENKIDMNIPATKSFEEDMHLTAWRRGKLEGTEVLLSTFPILLVKAITPIPGWKPTAGTERKTIWLVVRQKKKLRLLMLKYQPEKGNKKGSKLDSRLLCLHCPFTSGKSPRLGFIPQGADATLTE